MPVYVYRNLRTGETFEVEQRITEPALTAHPESGDPVKRLIQRVGIAFKGSGFYVTDSRKSGSTGDAGAKSTSSGPSGSSGKSDSGSKPDAVASGSTSSSGSDSN